MPDARATPTRKSFLIAVDRRNDGSTMTTIEPKLGSPGPQDMMEGLIGGLAAIYVSAWGDVEDDVDDFTPEEFCQLVASKLLARLASYEVEESTLQ